MINSIRGYIIYNFDYNFQQDNLKFEFYEINEYNNTPCYPSTFDLIKGREDDSEHGIYFQLINDTIYLREFDISYDKIDCCNDNDIFLTWEELWEEYETYQNELKELWEEYDT